MCERDILQSSNHLVSLEDKLCNDSTFLKTSNSSWHFCADVSCCLGANIDFDTDFPEFLKYCPGPHFLWFRNIFYHLFQICSCFYLLFMLNQTSMFTMSTSPVPSVQECCDMQKYCSLISTSTLLTIQLNPSCQCFRGQNVFHTRWKDSIKSNHAFIATLLSSSVQLVVSTTFFSLWNQYCLKKHPGFWSGTMILFHFASFTPYVS